MSVGKATKLKPLSLCFEDEPTEREYRAFHAANARRQLQRFVIFICVLSMVLSELIRYRLAKAQDAGFPGLPDWSAPDFAILTSMLLAGALLFSTCSRRLQPHLQVITMVCYGGLLLLDQWMTLRLPLVYTLSWALINLAIILTALQLRFLQATAMGFAFTVVHLAAMMYVHQPWQASVALQLSFAINSITLAGFNLMLMFVAHQRALNSRMAFARSREIAVRSKELENALDTIQRAEAQLIESEKQATVGRLVAGILHEVNNPIGALNSATDSLGRALHKAQSGNPAERRRALSLAPQLLTVQNQSTKRLEELVNGLSQFVSLDKEEKRAADVRTGVRTAAALLQPMLAENVTFELELPADAVWVHCFPDRLNQAVFSILQNAAAAFDTSTQNPKIRCVVRTGPKTDQCFIEVRDNGRGISAERQRQLFDVGFSHQGSRVKLHLGLPTSRKIVDELGGNLTLASAPGKGTFVEIRLPCCAAPAEAVPLVAE